MTLAVPVRKGSSMKRLNVRDAFVGEPAGVVELEEESGEEAVVLTVRGGELVVVVPPGTPDQRVLENPLVIRGALRLENEQVLTFEIHDSAVGAFFEHESADLHRRRQATGAVGLSSIEGVDYMETGRRLARDVMSTSLIWASPRTSIKELAELLAFHNISGVPVLEDGRLVGIVSEADVIGKRGQTVDEIMTRQVITVGEDEPLETVAQLMAAHRIKRVVVRRGEEPVGVISRADLIRALAG